MHVQLRSALAAWVLCHHAKRLALLPHPSACRLSFYIHPQAACLARCNGARVELYPYGSVGLAEFRAMVAEACRSAEEHIIVSYSRKEFLQTGGFCCRWTADGCRGVLAHHCVIQLQGVTVDGWALLLMDRWRMRRCAGLQRQELMETDGW